MGQYHLESMFNPRHIAVVGASGKKGTIGHALKPEILARFTQIDYDREIALVALDEEAQTDSMLGFDIGKDPDTSDNNLVIHLG